MPTLKCDACGEGPRMGEHGVIPLKRCARCKQTWYHDVHCQRKHYKEGHREVCVHHDSAKKIDKEMGTAKLPPSIPNQEQMIGIETGLSKGRHMVAKRSIAMDRFLSPSMLVSNESASSKGQQTHWMPLVPPVLVEADRSSRCAVCFAPIPSRDRSKRDQQCLHPKYPVLFCSEKCQQTGKPWLDVEIESLSFLYSSSPQVLPQVFQTGVLVYRLIRAMANDIDDPNWRCSSRLFRDGLRPPNGEDDENPLEQIMQNDFESHHEQEQIEWENNPASNSNDDDAFLHMQAVGLTVAALIRARVAAATVAAAMTTTTTTQSSTTATHKANLQEMVNMQQQQETLLMKYLPRLLSIIKINGFSICDKSNENKMSTLGIALYGNGAQYFNHSCRPNVFQSFEMGHPGQWPALSLTTVWNIHPGDELCISYIDIAMSRTMRQKELQLGYHFHCTCPSCSTEQR